MRVGLFKKSWREDFVDKLGAELLDWGEKLMSVLDEMPPPDNTVKPDDRPQQAAVRQADERIWRDEHGRTRPCRVCQTPFTVDGVYCRAHYPR